jgi:hypothetical protein
MEQEDNQGVCEYQTSEDRGMDSDLENSEDREGDPEERGMGSNPWDTEDRGHLEQEVDSNPQDDDLRGDSRERDIASTVCSGEKNEYPLRWQNSHLHWIPLAYNQGQHPGDLGVGSPKVGAMSIHSFIPSATEATLVSMNKGHS